MPLGGAAWVSGTLWAGPWEATLSPTLRHACRGCFHRRHIVRFRRRGLCAAARAAQLHCAPEPPRCRALARPGHSGLLHLIFRILHLISPGRQTRRRALRPCSPRPHRSVTSCRGHGRSRAGSGAPRMEALPWPAGGGQWGCATFHRQPGSCSQRSRCLSA